MDQLYKDLNSVSMKNSANCVHLSDFPKSDPSKIDTDLEQKMDIAQKITTMVLSLRKKERVRVRQPLQKIMIPISNEKTRKQIYSIKDILLSELNLKEIEFIAENSDLLVKKIKPNFKTLGPKFGKDIKLIVSKVNQFSSDDIKQIESIGSYRINKDITISLSDVEITSADIPGWQVISHEGLTVALDVTISNSLKQEGLSRELVNRIQNIRKEKKFEVTDKIEIFVEKNEELENAITNNFSYICGETLANNLKIVDQIKYEKINIELVDNISINISIKKINNV